jgi:hypothetical protein
MWSSLKQHLLAFACLMLAVRFIVTPAWSSSQPASDTCSYVQQAAGHLVDSIGSVAPAVLVEARSEAVFPGNAKDVKLFACQYKPSQFAIISYAGGLVGSGSGHLRAPPAKLWLIHRALLL